MVSACQSSLKTTDQSLQFYEGKAEVFDKKKNKLERVYFHAVARYPDQLRLDVYMGILNIPIGTLIIKQNQAQLLSLMDRKIYVAKDGGQALEKLLKMQMTTAEITALFSEKFPLRGNWSCDLGISVQCQNGEARIDWDKNTEGQRTVLMESDRSKVTMIYNEESPRRANFEWKQPEGFQIINL